MNIIARASNRVFVGLPLCRNEQYLKSMGAFAQDVNTSFILLRFVPKILEPLLGRLIAIPNNRHFKQAAALHGPLVDERLANIAKKDANPDWDWEEPNDYLTWHIRLAQKENNQVELQPEMIGRRLMPINFGAIHTTVFTITNCFFDMLALKSVEEHGTHMSPVEVIRQEARAEYVASEGSWSKQSLARLVQADSAIRESMRVSNFLTRGLQRKVIAKEGIENKRAGWKLPFGATIGIDVHSVMHDPLIYPNPDSYDPFRFARAREQEEASSGSEGEQPKVAGSLESKQLGLSTTSGTFLPFGHGRHACPGRFLVSHELKMLLAYATMFYEIEPLETRPANTWFGQHVIPPMKAKIRVRRRRPDELGF
jgi:cytochrome P450